MQKLLAIVAVAGVLFASAGCDRSNSPNPLSPSGGQFPPPAPGPGTTRSLTPDDVIARVNARYPDRLAAGVSHDQRVANMEFLRDRIIEEGRCGGLRLAWNMKRGTGPRSIDAIGWQHGDNDTLDVVDIALAYDDTREPLRLQWIVVPGPAGWDPGAETTCGGA